MSMNLMAKAMNIKVGNPLRKLVLIKLADNANDNGECWPSYQHVADQCEVSRSTVKSHIRALEEMGLLKREFRRKGELNQSNVFYLTLDNAQQIQPESGGAGAARGGGAGAAPRTYHSFEPVNEPKNIMFEHVRTECEKTPDRHEETDKAFEEIFWCAGMRKAGKKNAASAFRTQFREWRKTTRGTASEFATMLAEDIACRNGKQFGFDRLLPSSYLNGQRWNDEKPETIQPQSKPSSAITVSKTGYVFFDR
ncbi:helix-turn-helix domain-containing protein [Salmonella enterica subsp. enterica serovar Schwarzengrund]|uniref:Helix-turn-helix domain-containing protein n=1 Tax=Escherichia coli TaxID=562 RepID=A0A8S7FEZ5_ECOLX|nr:helix-turn-helix domain-containing protein [Escherichia coli]EBO2011254.1 helix-turn-helix domain-containing protein [Salmonella enterica subsp. enterica serovar Schwarzengrund]EFQ6629280.1 helix-turn-helix domain-containing protein [Salmonella enterica]ECA9766032.1 helix-turn-helix domain-containing protein [Salmonella enterica subsp. enterica serovar Schwarzengrund]ECB6208490.1 helix-turn-helix domain-containing protein [Salmonella enterica subsp. enterica serovar Schwarzengrund]ECI323329